MPAKTPELLLAAARCSQCLTTRNRIVSGERAAGIVRDCRQTGRHFFCHKGTDQKLHCRGVHDILLQLGGSQAYQMAVALRIPVREIDADALS